MMNSISLFLLILLSTPVISGMGNRLLLSLYSSLLLDNYHDTQILPWGIDSFTTIVNTLTLMLSSFPLAPPLPSSPIIESITSVGTSGGWVFIKGTLLLK